MNKETKLSIIIEAKNKAEDALKSVNRQLSDVKTSSEDLLQATKNVGIVATGAFLGIAGAIGVSVKEAMMVEKTQIRLAQILKTSTNATDQQISALIKQADALEKVGVVSADAIVQAQGQLASFDLQTESIEKLIPSLLNYAVAEKGVGATSEDLQGITNGLAQALNGQFGALTRVGFVLDEETKVLIANGTETERVAALAKVLDSTYSGLNETLRNTAEGALFGLQQSFGKLQETIGVAFLPILNDLVQKITPVIEKVVEWVQKNPELTRNLLLAGLAVSGLTAAMMLLLPIVIAVTTPVGLLTLALIAFIATLVFTIVQVYRVAKQWDDVWILMQIAVLNWANFIKDAFEQVINFIIGGINAVIRAINSAIDAISKVPMFGKKFKNTQIKTIEDVNLQGFDTDALYGKISGGGGGNSTNITVTGNTFLDETSAEKMGDLIMKQLGMSNAF